jgi:hypothetical protein
MIQPIDPYFIYWYAQLVPIYDYCGTFSRLTSANRWIEQYLPNFLVNRPVARRNVSDTRFSLAVKKTLELFLIGSVGDLTERFLKRIQKNKMIRNKSSKQWENSTAVIIGDDILKFHENDRRKMYADRFMGKLSSELG